MTRQKTSDEQSLHHDVDVPVARHARAAQAGLSERLVWIQELQTLERMQVFYSLSWNVYVLSHGPFGAGYLVVRRSWLLWIGGM